MSKYTPACGDRIRFTRVQADGKTQFVKTGQVMEVGSTWFEFRDGETWKPWYLSLDSAEFASMMLGWSQSYERIGGE